MRWALAKVAVAVTTMVALAFLVPLGMMVQETAHDRAFSAAERQAAELGPALAITTDHAALQRALASTKAGTDGLVAVHVPDAGGGTSVLGTGRADAAQLAAATASGRSATVEVPGGYALLQPVAVDNARIALVEVFVPEAALSAGVTTAWLVLSGVAAALVLISVLVADRLGTRIVGAARRLAAAARDLGSGDLDARAPAADADAPPELREAAAAFNAMAERVRQLLASERELAADLSHRLRTPLTVLRLNTAALGESESADQARLAVARLEHEVDQIIRAARGRREDETVVLGCDAADVVRDRTDFWSALAEDQGRRWRVDGTGRSALVPVSRADLANALDAVLGNVFRHTDEGVSFGVDVRTTDYAVTIRVYDSGPGIPDPEAALRRGEGAGGAGSTGLGLDIARRVAESTGGELTIGRTSRGGADIRLRLRTARALSKAS
ncbi:signal transduction histidine kinase [Amycolatopsis bartoniae]|uniref:Signal transduction histidine-protein kinase/phosphatase MprB n=1 Tax=Amycolatopsis bartoniae TaxID=941986 RepID=A0A8H9IS59_9PSEU|nr:HAMP domain-containing sensor histidine kinase [Amycolatopsis bartoniae]MBB2939597.1 signal transduction histidine kinase [Amycolatopsis bartoniae]TVT07807.1 HAMP domain-containing histidine kinase [Amycolatopsis bartoniae]GHF39496.1 two-component sensor histidine kinase [Amycolatopsis bartoniae]